MAENELAEWAAGVAAKPYGERIYRIELDPDEVETLEEELSLEIPA